MVTVDCRSKNGTTAQVSVEPRESGLWADSRSASFNHSVTPNDSQLQVNCLHCKHERMRERKRSNVR